MDTVIFYLASLVALVFVFAPHEFAHAFVAYKCGDATAKMRGRMTLNPFKHMDPMGFVLCAVDASIILTRSSAIATASIEAASGRHKNV